MKKAILVVFVAMITFCVFAQEIEKIGETKELVHYSRMNIYCPSDVFIDEVNEVLYCQTDAGKKQSKYKMNANMGFVSKKDIRPKTVTDNLLTVCVVYAVQAMPVYIFLMVGFIRRIDNGFIEAAVIDGAGEFTIFTKVILPFVKPTLMFIALGSIMNVWNEYTLARTFLESEKHYTISVGIQSIQNAFTYSFDYGALFACLVLSMIPILILYILFQKQIQEGTDAGEGIKG